MDDDDKDKDSEKETESIKTVIEFVESQKKKELEAEIEKKAREKADASTDGDSLKAELEAALKENATLKDNRRKELLMMLDVKDQKSYKDEPIEAIQLLVTHLKKNPKVRGIERPDSDKDDKDDKRTTFEKHPGYIGGRDVRTGKRY